jgi:hypothetical protein
MTEWLQKQLFDDHPQKLDFDSVTYTRRHHLTLDKYDVYQINNQKQAWSVTAEEGFPEQLTKCSPEITEMLMVPFLGRDIYVDSFYVNVLKPTN